MFIGGIVAMMFLFFVILGFLFFAFVGMYFMATDDIFVGGCFTFIGFIGVFGIIISAFLIINT